MLFLDNFVVKAHCVSKKHNGPTENLNDLYESYNNGVSLEVKLGCR